MTGTHYYPGSRPLNNLKSLVANGAPRPAWNSEVHWDNTVGDVMDDAEAALATLFDCTDSGLSGYVWWAYTRTGVKGGLQKRFTTTTIGSRALNVTDSDGSAATLGQVITRAYRSGTNLTIWAVNNTSNTYNPYRFNLARGSINGTVSFEQWNTDGSSTGLATTIIPHDATRRPSRRRRNGRCRLSRN